MAVIEEYKKFNLEFNKYAERFEAKHQDGKVITTSSSFSGLKANVDAYVKRQKKIKPFDIIWLKRDEIVKLSSLASDDLDEIWISWKDPDQTRRSRSKERLTYGWGTDPQPNFIKINSKNLEILVKIKKAQKGITKLSDHISKLRESYTEPITSELMEELLNKNRGE